MNERCNVLFIMADQFRYDALRHIGGVGRTRALDGLAAEGVSFRRPATNSPECIPARFALATGLYPHQTGVWRNAPVTLSPSAWTWMQSLVAAGYRTSVFGKTLFPRIGPCERRSSGRGRSYARRRPCRRRRDSGAARKHQNKVRDDRPVGAARAMGRVPQGFSGSFRRRAMEGEAISVRTRALLRQLCRTAGAGVSFVIRTPRTLVLLGKFCRAARALGCAGPL